VGGNEIYFIIMKGIEKPIPMEIKNVESKCAKYVYCG